MCDPSPVSEPGVTRRRFRWLALALGATAILVGACDATQVSPSLGSTAAGPARPTGATDVILRLDEGGGATSPTFLAIQPPTFTLYGDGTVIVRDLAHDAPPAPVGPAAALAPFRVLKVSEAEIARLLALAVGDGGLGAARATYEDPGIAPIPRAVFTVNPDGRSKSVAIVGLDVAVSDGPDVLARQGFARLARTLRSYRGEAGAAGEPYAPARYRALLLLDESGPTDLPPHQWPWLDLAPRDFVGGTGPGELGWHVLTEAQANVLGVVGYQGGFQGLSLAGPADGKVYALQLRPLLPDEPG